MTNPPIALLAELTHRCPLACPYCSNPLDLLAREAELETETWARVFREAAAMGVLQLHLSGGEPASRRDLEALVTAAREAGKGWGTGNMPHMNKPLIQGAKKAACG